MWRDLQFALRAIRRQPWFAAMVLITLSLGIGGSVAIFTVVNAVFLRSLPYPDANQIYLMRTILVGLVPALRLAHHPLRTLMNEEGRGVSGGRVQRRLFGGLIVAEIALALLQTRTSCNWSGCRYARCSTVASSAQF